MKNNEPDEKSGLIIFEENLTLEGLQRIKQESENYPATADTKETYKLVYDQHQRFKRLHVAVRKKAEDLIKTAKSDFEAERDKINADLQFVLDVIEPIRDKLETARTDYEAAEKAEKERLAHEEAERQQAELKRQQEERERIAAEQEAERKRLADEAARLERERYEFECEKSRLDFDAAWDDANENGYKFLGCAQPEPTAEEKIKQADSFMTELCESDGPTVSHEELDALLDDIATGEDWKPPVVKPEDVVTPVNFGISINDLPISEDLKPSPMDQQKQRYEKLKSFAGLFMADIHAELKTGFESQPITDHLYNFAQVLDGFINTFPEQ